MKLAILGAGNVGSTLGQAWSKVGHKVFYGVKNPKTGTAEMQVENAVSNAEIVVLSVPWHAVPTVLEKKELFREKIVIDCTNPINADFSGLTLGHNDSGGETVSRLVPQAKVVKAFNTCGFNVMANPLFGNIPAAMFVASDDTKAKEIVLKLAKEIGFDPVDAGPILQSRYLEATAWLWISMALKYGQGREIAFSLLHR